MKKLLALVLWALICPQIVFAQGPQRLCYTTDGQNCITVSPTTPLPVANSSSSTGGATVSSAIAPATPAGVNLKATTGTLYGIQATTIQATPVYIKFYNSASAPTCGSGTPIARIMVPAALKSTAKRLPAAKLITPAVPTNEPFCTVLAVAFKLKADDKRSVPAPGASVPVSLVT